MTGKETWEFIAPIIASHSTMQKDGKLDQFDKAYVMIYGALKFWDEHHKENENDRKRANNKTT